MLGQKINKNPSKIHHKTALKSTPQLASILEPTWLHFWRGLGAKMGPNRFKNRSSNPSKNWSHFRSLLGPILVDFGPQLGAQNGPGSHLEGILKPSWSEKVKKNPTKMGPQLITFNQHDPKYPQSHPRTAPWTSFSLIFDWFLMDF